MKFPILCSLLLLALPVLADTGTCHNAFDIDAAAKSAMDSAAQSLFQQAQRGDYFGLRAASIPSLASSFGGVEAAIGENRAALQNATATLRSQFLLEAPASRTPRTEFLCGAYPDLVGFAINNLPAGRYGIVILDVKGGKPSIAFSAILQDVNGWKLAGLYLRPTELSGHDGAWYLAQANNYKTRGQTFGAYLYYLEAWQLQAPLNFMSTPQLDRISDSIQSNHPPDMPSNGNAVDLPAAGKTYRLTEVFPAAVAGELQLVVRYQATSNVADRTATARENIAVIRALVAKHPELREAFATYVARAVGPAGEEFGSTVTQKDLQ